jgi:hypothetical protein
MASREPCPEKTGKAGKTEKPKKKKRKNRKKLEKIGSKHVELKIRSS